MNFVSYLTKGTNKIWRGAEKFFSFKFEKVERDGTLGTWYIQEVIQYLYHNRKGTPGIIYFVKFLARL